MKTLTKITHWTPRLLCILAILLVSMFALDSFERGRSMGAQLLAFLIHMIPSFILIAALIIAWKWEKTGGIILILLGAAFGALILKMNLRRTGELWTSLSIVMALAFPFFLSGVLFIISNYLKKKDAGQQLPGE